MPIYLNPKHDISIPPDASPDTSDSDCYLNDPDMRYDRLPQPFHAINKIVTKILHEALLQIDRNNRRRLFNQKRKAVQDIHEYSTVEVEYNMSGKHVLNK